LIKARIGAGGYMFRGEIVEMVDSLGVLFLTKSSSNRFSKSLK